MELITDQLRRFTVDEYLQMAEAGILPPDERTELLDGRIVLKMGQDSPHVGGIALALWCWCAPWLQRTMSFPSDGSPDLMVGTGAGLLSSQFLPRATRGCANHRGPVCRSFFQ